MLTIISLPTRLPRVSGEGKGFCKGWYGGQDIGILPEE
jgi:hypothetical protein